MTGWTEDRVDLLAKLWHEGRSSSEIAAEMGGGLTRNAVIGKVHRLGLPDPGVAKSSRPKGERQPTAAAAPKPTTAEPAAAAPSAPKPIDPAPAPLPPGPVTILDLRDGLCRWPLGDPRSDDFRYCGARATAVVSGALVYCAVHGSMAFQPSHERRRFAALPVATAQHHPRITAAA